MQSFLQSILPRILPPTYRLGENCFIRTHEGKADLQKSIPRKVRAYRNYPQPVRLLIIQDQDSNDCRKLKAQLNKLVRQETVELPLLVRIACRELENWYLGDLPAVEQLYPASKASVLQNKARYHSPDNLHGSVEIARLTKRLHKNAKRFSKSDCARRIGRHMDLHNNRSASFRCFVSGIERFCNPTGTAVQ